MVNNKEISMIELLIETHAGLERQGPGSPEMTIKALSFIDEHPPRLKNSGQMREASWTP